MRSKKILLKKILRSIYLGEDGVKTDQYFEKEEKGMRDKWNKRESEEAFKRVKKIDWVIVSIGFIVGFVLIISGIIFWEKLGMFIVAGFAIMVLSLLHLAWASKSKKGRLK